MGMARRLIVRRSLIRPFGPPAKALAVGAKPRYDTILKVTRALGVRLHAQSR
jgi:hypothetical protein